MFANETWKQSVLDFAENGDENQLEQNDEENTIKQKLQCQIIWCETSIQQMKERTLYFKRIS